MQSRAKLKVSFACVQDNACHWWIRQSEIASAIEHERSILNTYISKVSELSQKQGNELVNKQASNNSSVLDVVSTVAPSQCSCTLAIMVAH